MTQLAPNVLKIICIYTIISALKTKTKTPLFVALTIVGENRLCPSFIILFTSTNTNYSKPNLPAGGL